MTCNFNTDGFDSLYPRYKGGYPLKFALARDQEDRQVKASRA
jgi:hypothetical protein